MIRALVIAAIMLVAASLEASAQSRIIFGEAGTTCGTWTQARQSKSRKAGLSAQWVAGEACPRPVYCQQRGIIGSEKTDDRHSIHFCAFRRSRPSGSRTRLWSFQSNSFAASVIAPHASELDVRKPGPKFLFFASLCLVRQVIRAARIRYDRRVVFGLPHHLRMRSSPTLHVLKPVVEQIYFSPAQDHVLGIAT